MVHPAIRRMSAQSTLGLNLVMLTAPLTSDLPRLADILRGHLACLKSADIVEKVFLG
jgi:hypothetical protein